MRCKLVKEYNGLNVHMEIYEPINIKKAFQNILKYKLNKTNKKFYKK
jgi:hypothetical protein